MLDAWHALIQESSIQQHRLVVDRGDDCQRNYHDGSACPRCQRIGAYRDVVAVLFDVPDTCSAPPSLVALGSINGAHPAYRSGILNTASPEKTKFETAGRSRLQQHPHQNISDVYEQANAISRIVPSWLGQHAPIEPLLQADAVLFGGLLRSHGTSQICTSFLPRANSHQGW